MSSPIKLKRHEDRDSGISLTPLIDIMFLITIFFVLTSSNTHKPALEVNLPEAQTGKPSLSQEMSITIGGKGDISVNGREVTLDSLVPVLQQEAGSQVPDTVMILGDQSVPYGILITVMDRVRALGWENISLVTRSRRPGG